MLQVFCVTQNLECLPFAGGWAEQPFWITQALEILKLEKWKADEEERERKTRAEEQNRRNVRR
jgi:hypothetical protein